MKQSTISAIRFGYGFAPDQTAPDTVEALLSDAIEASKHGTRVTFATRRTAFEEYRQIRKLNDTDQTKAAQKKLRDFARDDTIHHISAAIDTGSFGERLVNFWADHFTVAARSTVLRMFVPDFIASAIRPNIAGFFPTMLRAVATHPAMLSYLNQAGSVGPNSRVGQSRDRGLNENFAREILELHTLGVKASYSQQDVREFAKLLTGLSIGKLEFKYRTGISEPGPLTVLGKTYGGKTTTLENVFEALNDIAMHPETALHLSRKLVFHFIGVDDADLTQKMAQAYLTSGGDLKALYAVLLDSELAWEPNFTKAKLPFDFIVSALRAAGSTKTDLEQLSEREIRRGITGAMQLMGQTFLTPSGPDGWSEDPETWITPPGLAARIRWATAFAERIEATQDPRDFLAVALGDAATPLLEFAVGGSESRVEGIALTLVSPEFNRR